MVESMKTPAWAESAARLAESMKTPAWAESVSFLTGVMEDRAWLEAFAATAGIEIEIGPTPTPTEGSLNDSGTESLANKKRRATLLAIAVYLAAALALHVSNFISTADPVFDAHQLITDEFIAMGLALAFLLRLLERLTFSTRSRM